MDHNLDNTLNLGDSIEESVVTEMFNPNTDGIPMEFDQIVEQPIMMDSSQEEVVELMSDSFTLGGETEYTVQDQVMDSSMLSSQSDTILDISYEPQTLQVKQETSAQPQIINIMPSTARPMSVVTSMRSSTVTTNKGTIKISKPVAIAPKPTAISMVPGKTVKNVSISNVVQAQKGQQVIAQIGKQLVVVPAGSGQKIKLLQSGGQPIQAQFVTTKNIVNTGKPILAKYVVQGQDQSAVLTKITPTSNAGPQRVLTMQPKTVPISLADNVLRFGSPSKQVNRINQSLITIKSPTTKKVVLTRAPVSVTKKVVLSGNTQQNVLIRSATPHTMQAIKTEPNADSPTTSQTQIHQINVPGKGVQYIRLVTNPTNATSKTVNMATKSYMVTDKGNILMSTGDTKVINSQGQQIVVTSGPATKKLIAKNKLVRIAPASNKMSNAISTKPGQSLLAPLSTEEDVPTSPEPPQEEVQDSKAALRALIEDAVRESPQKQEDNNTESMHEGEIEVILDKGSAVEMHQGRGGKSKENLPFIVIPSEYMQKAPRARKKSHADTSLDESFNFSDPLLTVNQSMDETIKSPPHLSDNDLEFRPRKPCNCNRSQCLKLYCECFANGEFCNRCNCTNCHNNLENEELRQKAIRGCLDRNPYAFRPKIGKTKSSGPVTVRRHNKGCNCKRSGCLKNYCECYEAKIACTAICKCIGCRNVEDNVERMRRRDAERREAPNDVYRPLHNRQIKQPCSFMTTGVIEAVCQCLVAAGSETAPTPAAVEGEDDASDARDPVVSVLEEFSRCLHDIISAAHQAPPTYEANA